MNGGVKNLLVAVSFAAAGCASAPNAVEVRPIADPRAKLRPGADLLADAKGQLAIGNVGLALEGFRKAARDYPDNPDAYAGMAACYEAMRRYDLAEQKYQAALALAPHSPVLLGRLAMVLEQQGKSDAASSVRGEIAQLASASDALDRAEPDPEPAAASLAPAQSVTVALPAPDAALPAPQLASTQTVTVALPSPKLAAVDTIALPEADVAAPALPDTQPQAEAVQTVPHLAAADLVDRQPVHLLNGASPSLNPLSVEPFAPALALPSEPVLPHFPAPVLTANVPIRVGAVPQVLQSVALGPLAPVLAVPAEVSASPMLPRSAAVAGREPRLERLSLGEVALLTGGGPVWKDQAPRTVPKMAIRWVPVTTASVTRPNIRLFNAARVQGLAARNREYLLDRGWRKIEIADASAVRERSLVLYPLMRPQIGRSLAAQFGFRAQPTTTSDVFVVLLGRDAVALRAAPTRG
jgi:hypothetical protein